MVNFGPAERRGWSKGIDIRKMGTAGAGYIPKTARPTARPTRRAVRVPRRGGRPVLTCRARRRRVGLSRHHSVKDLSLIDPEGLTRDRVEQGAQAASQGD
jgi:hypothetical protein